MFYETISEPINKIIRDILDSDSNNESISPPSRKNDIKKIKKIL
jgi:hypothetical protein